MSAAGQLWVVEHHVKGGVRVGLLHDVVERNAFMLQRDKEPGWYPVAVAPDMATARVLEVEYKRKLADREQTPLE